MDTTKSFSYTDTKIGIIKSALRTRIMHINDMIETLSANKTSEFKFIIDKYKTERTQVEAILLELILC